jgi:hypothetical protein
LEKRKRVSRNRRSARGCGMMRGCMFAA